MCYCSKKFTFVDKRIKDNKSLFDKDEEVSKLFEI